MSSMGTSVTVSSSAARCVCHLVGQVMELNIPSKPCLLTPVHCCVQVKCQSDGLAAAAVLQQLFSKGGPSALKALYAGAVI